ncbi:MAG: hypothetical protein F6J97_26630, partial [Leptolyngbya sp. SIO4C1]|nr:hypothetical protein [Leptolyngbya sp. SIO4C1]
MFILAVPPAAAQEPTADDTYESALTSQSASQYQVLHVNSAAGSDVNSGTQ